VLFEGLGRIVLVVHAKFDDPAQDREMVPTRQPAGSNPIDPQEVEQNEVARGRAGSHRPASPRAPRPGTMSTRRRSINDRELADGHPGAGGGEEDEINSREVAADLGDPVVVRDHRVEENQRQQHHDHVKGALPPPPPCRPPRPLGARLQGPHPMPAKLAVVAASQAHIMQGSSAGA